MLAEIIARKRIDVAERQARTSLETLLSGIAPSTRSLAEALRQPGSQLILECKRASPSQGLIRQDFEPSTIARAYAPFAAAISVLTDTPFFEGQFDFIRQVRSAFDGPILCKDFVLGPYQVAEARYHGADAVLIMLSVLDDAQAQTCLELAKRLKMDALVEVHDELELKRALALDAAIIGINNRNLKTLQVDLSVSEQLAPRVPAGHLVIAESGVANRADMLRLAPHVDGFLIGTSLMREPDLDTAVRELIFGRVKVCGLRRPADAAVAYRLGASWGGLILAPGSPRLVAPERAHAVRQAAPLRWAGVFVDAAPSALVALAERLQLDAVQLHGHEDASYRQQLRARLPRQCELWQMVPVDIGAPLKRVTAAAEKCAQHSDRLLFDSRVLTNQQALHSQRAEPLKAPLNQPPLNSYLSGGTGQAIQHELLAKLDLRNALAAGGLGPHNAAQVAALQPWGIDVNSAVEQAPGQKSHTLLKSLFSALRPGKAADQSSKEL